MFTQPLHQALRAGKTNINLQFQALQQGLQGRGEQVRVRVRLQPLQEHLRDEESQLWETRPPGNILRGTVGDHNQNQNQKRTKTWRV